MANAQRPVAPARKLLAALLGTVATFITLFGLGMTSWAIVALGVALVALSIALGTVRSGGRAWVIGSAHVQSVSEPPASYAFGRCEVQIVIDAPGLPPRSKKLIEPRVPVAKWPVPGQTLPVRVAIDDQRRVRILWDEVPTHAEAAAAAAAAGLPPEFDEPPLDEVLIGQDAPPWARREQDPPPWTTRSTDDDLLPPIGDPVPAGPVDDLDGLPDDREPVVVRHTPGGLVVLEGTLVEAPAAAPLPRRPAAAPAVTPARVDQEAEPTVEVTTVDPGRADGPTLAPAGDERSRRNERNDRDELIDLPLDDLPTGLDDDLVDPDLYPAEPATTGAPISGVGITLLVTDLLRSVAFYTDTLGFLEIDGGDGNAVLASGSTRLVLREITEAAPINRRLVHLNLEVPDIDAAHERLRDAGVRFTYAPRVVNRGNRLELWAAAFRDPDGHGIALTQWRDRVTD
ncbi:VOC family protein [Micromonospora echinofusca]|uniref:Glyoxalase/bleomycin resistance/dioxygenase family protein n=1 Tax=Micromonospora echinofusca TaxID=47858 RepID=A0ABS3VX69_MICEH|nr:VOC family protein [Micromonospora echinofusca]MBO4208969.1 glyoxalase/bleomycin resistance/dioxygenase family protein [Micromonospora echinofusca]